MPYKNKADRMKRQQSRRDTPDEVVDTPTHFDTPWIKCDTPVAGYTINVDTPVRIDTPIDTPVTYTGLARLISTPQGKKKLDRILGAFQDSSHPEYMQDVRLGIFGPTLWAISKL